MVHNRKVAVFMPLYKSNIYQFVICILVFNLGVACNVLMQGCPNINTGFIWSF